MPIDLSKTQLADKFNAAGKSIRKQNMGGLRAAVYLVLDYSRSMGRFYRNGSVQHLTEQALALSAHVDDDGTVPVILFSGSAHEPADVSVNDFDGAINRIVATAGSMGSTNYTAAMRKVIDLHRGKDVPAFVIFQTDGAPDSKRAAQQVLCEASRLPIFWQFVGFGDDEFAFLRKLDELPVPAKRAVDNAGFYPAGMDPKGVPNEVVFAALLAEFPSWLAAYAQMVGIGVNR